MSRIRWNNISLEPIALPMLLFVCTLLQGCGANYTTVERRTELPGWNEQSNAKAIHLDAKQRVVIYKSFGAFCAEPSPDALSAFGAALGASLSKGGSGDAVSISHNFNELAQNIGLRTQSIQLMRDANYRLCELYLGRALKGETVASLFRNYQDIMIGVLAIEQLTEPLKANQGSLVSKLTLDSAASSGVTLETVDELVKKEQTAKDEYDSAKATTASAKTALETAQNSLTSAGASATQAQKDALEKTKATHDAAAKTEATKKGLYEIQKEVRVAVTNQVTGSKASNSTSSDSNSSFQSATRSTPTDQAIPYIAHAVNNIVGNILSKDYSRETCMEILLRVMDGDYHPTYSKGDKCKTCDSTRPHYVPLDPQISKTIDEVVKACTVKLQSLPQDLPFKYMPDPPIAVPAQAQAQAETETESQVAKSCPSETQYQVHTFGASETQIAAVKSKIGDGKIPAIDAKHVDTKVYSTGAADRLESSTTLRFFYSDDKAFGQKLGAKIQELLGSEVSLTDLSSVDIYKKVVCPGHMELWLKKP